MGFHPAQGRRYRWAKSSPTSKAPPLGIGSKVRVVPEAPSEAHHGQRLTIVSGAETVAGATGGRGTGEALEALAFGETAEKLARVWHEA
jgi:hypothetical protein